MNNNKNVSYFREIVSIFAKNNNFIKKEIKNITKQDIDALLIEDIQNEITELILNLIKKTNKDKDFYLYSKEAILNTFKYFKQNRYKGEKLIVNLQKILLNVFCGFDLIDKKDKRLIYKRTSIFKFEVKQHTYYWLYFAYKQKKKLLLNGDIVIPFDQYFYENKVDFFYKGYKKNFDKTIAEFQKFFKIKDEDMKEKIIIETPLLEEELKYAKEYIKRLFLEIKKYQPVFSRIIITPYGNFFLVKKEFSKYKIDTFYFGKTKYFLEYFIKGAN